MASGRPRPAGDWSAEIRAASGHQGPWPRVSVWHGEADATVRSVNATEILKQWRDLHGLDDAPLAGEARTPAHRHLVWHGADGTPLLEHHAIAGMPHGVPIGPRHGEAPLGQAAPFILDVGLSSTHAIAAFFGLDAPEASRPQTEAAQPQPVMGLLRRVITIGRDGTARVDAPAAPPRRLPEVVPRPAPEAAPVPTPEAVPRPMPAAPQRPAPQARSEATPRPTPEAPSHPTPEAPRAGPTPPKAEAPDTEAPRTGRLGRLQLGQVIRRALEAAGLLTR
jgi:hypothetical protein